MGWDRDGMGLGWDRGSDWSWDLGQVGIRNGKRTGMPNIPHFAFLHHNPVRIPRDEEGLPESKTKRKTHLGFKRVLAAFLSCQ